MQILRNIPFSYIEIPGFKPFIVESTVKQSGLKEGQNTIFVRNVRELHKLTRLWNDNSKTRKYNIVSIQRTVLHKKNESVLRRERSNVRDRKNI